jgi:hypothetical protein
MRNGHGWSPLSGSLTSRRWEPHTITIWTRSKRKDLSHKMTSNSCRGAKSDTPEKLSRQMKKIGRKNLCLISCSINCCNIRKNSINGKKNWLKRKRSFRKFKMLARSVHLLSKSSVQGFRSLNMRLNTFDPLSYRQVIRILLIGLTEDPTVRQEARSTLRER